MSISEELLMAYADGELDSAEHAAERAEVEAAIKADPEVASRVEKHKSLRRQLGAAFDGVLDETVPDRLVAAARSARTVAREATVTDLSRVRAAKAAESAARSASARPVWTWAQWGAIAASLVVGAIIGHVALKSPELSPIATRGGHLVAQAGLERALSNQLASNQAPTAPVQIGVSFKSKAGDYCRTFVIHEREAIGGLACREGEAWRVHTLARAEGGSGTEGGYRPAGSEMPAAVRAAVEEQIAGEPLDASGEAQAKEGDWKK
jgi:anti-sigma factor RsiW